MPPDVVCCCWFKSCWPLWEMVGCDSGIGQSSGGRSLVPGFAAGGCNCPGSCPKGKKRWERIGEGVTGWDVIVEGTGKGAVVKEEEGNIKRTILVSIKTTHSMKCWNYGVIFFFVSSIFLC